MRVLFIMPLALPAYLFQLAALAAYLKSKGHQVEYEELVIDGKVKPRHLEKVRLRIRELNPHLVGFSSYEMSFPWIETIADYIKGYAKGLPIIVGGYYPTLAPDEAIKHPSIDIICRGEGEYAMEELLKSIEDNVFKTDIQNLWFKDGDKIIKNPIRPLISNLDELPFVDRALFTSEQRKGGALEVMASRGCAFDCTHCSNHALKNLYSGKGSYVRYRSVNHVLSEIEYWQKSEDIKQVQFEDDLFTLNKNWIREFCGEYKDRIGLPFYCNLRPGQGAEEVLPLLREAGCVHVSVGVESGDDYIRKKVLGRNISEVDIISLFKITKDTGIKRKSFTMVGLPGETAESIWKTIKLNYKLAPDSVQTSVYYPFKGTALGDECYRKGWVDLKRKERLSLYANDSILNLPTVSRDFIKRAKWLNSATALRGGALNTIKEAFGMAFRRLKIRNVR